MTSAKEFPRPRLSLSKPVPLEVAFPSGAPGGRAARTTIVVAPKAGRDAAQRQALRQARAEKAARPAAKPVAPCRERFDAMLALARSRFTRAFPKRPVPLAVGLHKPLAEALGLSVRQSRLFLDRYCNSLDYLGAIAAGGVRRALNGAPAGEVTPEQQEVALAAIAAAKAARKRPDRSAAKPKA